jgi:MFS family permease
MLFEKLNQTAPSAQVFPVFSVNSDLFPNPWLMHSPPDTAHLPAVGNRKLWNVIIAASLGTLIEWYDFFIFGALAALIIGPQYFPQNNDPLIQTMSALATFAAGFIVRPFGALVFGRLGDVVGRKHTFLVTLLLMGGSTFAIAFVPTFAQIGYAAPAILLILRLIQGLALGGEYGGATTYVAEHAPDDRRGFYVSFVQITATGGLVLSIGVILACRTWLSADDFAAWGWRIPFLASGLLVVGSYFIRRNMAESPVFAQLKTEGRVSKNPLRESFTKKENLRLVLLALFGLTAGQGCVYYTVHFYSSVFIGTLLKVDFVQTNQIMLTAMVLASPLSIGFGALSDKIKQRKPIMMLGLALFVVFAYPIYGQISATVAESFRVQPGPLLTDSARNWLIVYVFVQVLFSTMIYGPIAAFLVELFPTHIRYTSLSLPYHIGNGIFGGLTPFIATALISATGNNIAGLAYPVGVSAVTVVVGVFLLKERPHNLR